MLQAGAGDALSDAITAYEGSFFSALLQLATELAYPPAVAAALAHDQDNIRHEAAQLLSEADVSTISACADELAAAMDDDSEFVRAYAVRALARVGDPRAGAGEQAAAEATFAYVERLRGESLAEHETAAASLACPGCGARLAHFSIDVVARGGGLAGSGGIVCPTCSRRISNAEIQTLVR